MVVGSGLAGVQTAVQLREQGWTGEVLLIGAERHLPYDRPPLSKAVLLGSRNSGSEGPGGGTPPGDRPAPTAAEVAFDIDFPALDVELLLDRRAIGVRPGARLLDTEAGPVPYDHLVIATGAEPVALPGSEAVPGIHLLRTLDDAVRLRSVLSRRLPVVVVGAGWIGAEFATAARTAGCAVTVVEAADHPLAGVLPPELAAPMEHWYQEYGVELRCGQPVTALASDGVQLADGTRLPAETVLLGVGSRPATGWLAGSGIELAADRSVCADERLQTSVPRVYAVGDCASFPSARYGQRLLVHHWDNALQGPRVVAANIVASELADGAASGARYDPVPYFWSEQFGRFVQYVGHHTGRDELLWRGDPGQAAWAVCWLRADVLIALFAVGRPRDVAQGRKLIARGAALDRERAADAAVPLKNAVVRDGGG